MIGMLDEYHADRSSMCKVLTAQAVALVNYEEFNSSHSIGTVWFSIVSDLITHSWRQQKFPAIGKLSMQFTFQT